MSPRMQAIAAVLVGASIGLSVLAATYASVEQWYATSATPLVLVLCPGLVVGLFNPASSGLYFALVLVVQAVAYSLAALGIWLLLGRTTRRGNDAV